jgi:hypothetical protein
MKYPPLYLFNIFLLIIFLSCGHNAGAATQLHLEKKNIASPCRNPQGFSDQDGSTRSCSSESRMVTSTR